MVRRRLGWLEEFRRVIPNFDILPSSLQLYPFSTKMREVLGNRWEKSQGLREISRVERNLKGWRKSQGRREISRVERNLKGWGKSQELREILRAERISQYLPIFDGLYTLSHRKYFYSTGSGIGSAVFKSILLWLWCENVSCCLGCYSRLAFTIFRH